jgi:signal transduction histidine kinase
MSDRLFRHVALLAVLALGLQPFAVAAWLAPGGWLHEHLLLNDVLSWLSMALAGHMRPSILAAAAMLGYGLAPWLFAWAFWRASADRPSPHRHALLALQLLLALLFNDKWLVVLAGGLVLMLPLRQAWTWLAGQLLIYLAIYLAHAYQIHDGFRLSCNLQGAPAVLPPQEWLATRAGEIVQLAFYQLLAFGAGRLAAAERLGRLRLASLHAETRATQQLLADVARRDERRRIARELHDAAGHQLTALHLHLELAAHQAGTPENGALAQARRLARQLLAEIRSVVSQERQQAQGENR